GSIMQKYEFEVLGKPVAFKRPRWNSKTRQVFNENNYTAYKNNVRGHAARIVAGRLIGSIHAEIDIYMEIPKSWTAKEKERARSGEKRPTKKPDIDNYIKTFFDACNEIV
ncbi:RusA family crossover junction endodeoxyribonuclease, partial [Bifidobacterium pseudocatenulatum]|uniref:RusA family crossover junction endodeoxyribonuclease n=1 Tax=Bifidobacterium pseudocatenulatum TaxID=28026 RepID=UPI001EDB6178